MRSFSAFESWVILGVSLTKLAATAGLPAQPDSVGRYQIVGSLRRGAMGTV